MEKNIHINFPDEVGIILKALNDKGFEAYLVGGCVRDSIITKAPSDWDIATNAEPWQVKQLFDKTVDTGSKHGTITIVLNNKCFEATTFRIDGNYTDNRRPDSVAFTTSLYEDLGRRDFTINAIAYHPKLGIIDPYSGLEDIRQHMIRCVGKADTRFKEDALRMLRAARFSAQLDYSVHGEIVLAMTENAPLIKHVSQERIRDELNKLVVSPNPQKLELLHITGILKLILPELDNCFLVNQNNPHHMYDVANHTIKALIHTDCDITARWAVLLHDTGKVLTKTTDKNRVDHFYCHPAVSAKLAETALKRLRFDNRTIEKIIKLVLHHDRAISPTQKSVRKAIQAVGTGTFETLLKVMAADRLAQSPQYLGKKLEELETIRALYNEIIKSGACLDLKHLEINGDDLVGIGYSGKETGAELKTLLNAVVEQPALNNRSLLLKLAEKHYLNIIRKHN